MLKISVIIPFYNCAQLISRCLDSVFAQQGNFNLEVILINDGSTDNSVEIVQQYPKPIVLLQQSNQGPAAARNKGIAAATGKYLAFLDADDYWEPDFLAETVAFLESHPETIAVSVGQMHKIPRKANAISPKVLQTNPEKYNAPVELDDFYSFWATHNHVCTGSVLMKTKIVKKTGGQRTDLRITEDLEFWTFLATFGQWGFIPKILFVSDGGVVTRQTGWFNKNQKRWESAPGVDEWEKRIVGRLPSSLPTGFQQKRGQIAKNLAYSILLSGRRQLARQTVKQYKNYFPSDKLSKLLNFASKSKLLWFTATICLYWRERFRRV